MDGKERRLWIKALRGCRTAYRKLGILYLKGSVKKDPKLAKLCLEKAMEMGDEEGYLMYHRLFSRGREVIDDRSYRLIWKEHQKAVKEKDRQRLKRYLDLGTAKQKRTLEISGGQENEMESGNEGKTVHSGGDGGYGAYAAGNMRKGRGV